MIENTTIAILGHVHNAALGLSDGVCVTATAHVSMRISVFCHTIHLNEAWISLLAFFCNSSIISIHQESGQCINATTNK